MALKKTVTTPQGFEAADAYLRVEALALDDKTRMSFRVRAYKDQSANTAFDDQPFGCVYDMTGNNPIAQAYMHLKTLPEFADAKDC